MRQTALLLVIAVFGYAANAQFTLRPQIGIEDPLTKISYNNGTFVAPVAQFQPQIGINAGYKFKGGFGPFVNLCTSRPSINYIFDDPATGMTAYRAELGKTQLALQTGLQYSSKPLSLTKQSSAEKCNMEKSTSKSNCSFSHSCCSKSKTPQRSMARKDLWTVSLQPSLGIAFLPSTGASAVETKTSGTQTNYVYNTGVKSAITTGLTFEFAKNKTKFLSVSFNYFTGLKNDETVFTAQSASASKMVTASLRSKVSGWSVSVGVPISFSKTTNSKTKKTHHDCQQFRSRCQSVIRI